MGKLSSDGETDNLVETCECPEGYAGLSCETCAWGYVKVSANSSVHQDHRLCVKCDCNSHAGSCDLVMGECTVSSASFIIVYNRSKQKIRNVLNNKKTLAILFYHL